jgi:hypothetical protein
LDHEEGRYIPNNLIFRNQKIKNKNSRWHKEKKSRRNKNIRRKTRESFRYDGGNQTKEYRAHKRDELQRHAIHRTHKHSRGRGKLIPYKYQWIAPETIEIQHEDRKIQMWEPT